MLAGILYGQRTVLVRADRIRVLSRQRVRHVGCLPPALQGPQRNTHLRPVFRVAVVYPVVRLVAKGRRNDPRQV